MMYLKSTICAVLGASLVVGSSNAKPTTNSTKRGVAVPIMGGVDFPDPSIIKTNDGWHLFSTNTKVDGKWVNIQRAFTSDWKTFTLRRGVDALPKLPSWVDKAPRVWAPDVAQLSDGTFIMYYTAALKSAPKKHCLSYATAKKITDPFVDHSTAPWICPDGGGAIDVAGYTDETRTNRRYVVYKIDGNSIGHGGACGNTVKPIVPTPIMIQEVSKTDGHTKIGNPQQILTNIASDGPYIEAPALTYLNGKFTLFFSTNCYQGDKYDVQYATASSILGPYVRKGQVLRSNGPFGLVAPGGLDVAINGNHVLWHAKHSPGRAAFVGTLSVAKDGTVSVVL